MSSAVNAADAVVLCVFPDESDADSACVAWCGSAYLLVGQGA